MTSANVDSIYEAWFTIDEGGGSGDGSANYAGRCWCHIVKHFV